MAELNFNIQPPAWLERITTPKGDDIGTGGTMLGQGLGALAQTITGPKDVNALTGEASPGRPFAQRFQDNLAATEMQAHDPGWRLKQNLSALRNQLAQSKMTLANEKAQSAAYRNKTLTDIAVAKEGRAENDWALVQGDRPAWDKLIADRAAGKYDTMPVFRSKEYQRMATQLTQEDAKTQRGVMLHQSLQFITQQAKNIADNYPTLRADVLTAMSIQNPAMMEKEMARLAEEAQKIQASREAEEAAKGTYSGGSFNSRGQWTERFGPRAETPHVQTITLDDGTKREILVGKNVRELKPAYSNADADRDLKMAAKIRSLIDPEIPKDSDAENLKLAEELEAKAKAAKGIGQPQAGSGVSDVHFGGGPPNITPGVAETPPPTVSDWIEHLEAQAGKKGGAVVGTAGANVGKAAVVGVEEAGPVGRNVAKSAVQTAEAAKTAVDIGNAVAKAVMAKPGDTNFLKDLNTNNPAAFEALKKAVMAKPGDEKFLQPPSNLPEPMPQREMRTPASPASGKPKSVREQKANTPNTGPVQVTDMSEREWQASRETSNRLGGPAAIDERRNKVIISGEDAMARKWALTQTPSKAAGSNVVQWSTGEQLKVAEVYKDLGIKRSQWSLFDRDLNALSVMGDSAQNVKWISNPETGKLEAFDWSTSKERVKQVEQGIQKRLEEHPLEIK